MTFITYLDGLLRESVSLVLSGPLSSPSWSGSIARPLYRGVLLLDPSFVQRSCPLL